MICGTATNAFAQTNDELFAQDSGDNGALLVRDTTAYYITWYGPHSYTMHFGLKDVDADSKGPILSVIDYTGASAEHYYHNTDGFNTTLKKSFDGNTGGAYLQSVDVYVCNGGSRSDKQNCRGPVKYANPYRNN